MQLVSFGTNFVDSISLRAAQPLTDAGLRSGRN